MEIKEGQSTFSQCYLFQSTDYSLLYCCKSGQDSSIGKKLGSAFFEDCRFEPNGGPNQWKIRVRIPPPLPSR